MAWSNQTLAVIVLWTITVYLAVERKQYWIMLIPAIFMTAVVTSYIIVAPEGLQLPMKAGNITGISAAIILTMLFFIWKNRKVKSPAESI